MKSSFKSAIIAVTALLPLTILAQVTDTVKVVNKVVTETQITQGTDIKEKQPERSELRRGELGVRYMPTFVSLALRTYNGDIIEGEFTLSHGYGVLLGGNLSKNVGLQAEVNYLGITQKYKDQNLNRQIEVSYLNIPVMLSLNTDKSRMVNLNFVAGPQFGINLGSKMETTGTDSTAIIHAIIAAKGTDIGLAYGTGLEFALNKAHTFRLDLGYRGFYGLVDVNGSQSSSNPDTYNVLVRASRKTHAAYLGLTLCF